MVFSAKALRTVMAPSGITTRVNTVETSTPKAREIAMPLKIGSKMMTPEPPTNARAVTMIGRVRALQASSTDSVTGRPASTSWRVKSTSRIELRTMMPASAMKPIIEVAVNSAPNSQWPGMMPTRVSGIGAMMMAGRLKLPNSITTSM